MKQASPGLENQAEQKSASYVVTRCYAEGPKSESSPSEALFYFPGLSKKDTSSQVETDLKLNPVPMVLSGTLTEARCII